MMGNLGRAGFMPSTSGFWPYSYSACPADGLTPATSAPGSRVPARLSMRMLLLSVAMQEQ